MEKNKGEIIIYKADHGPEIKANLSNDTIWLTQAQIAELFDIERSVITKHFKNIFLSQELNEKSNVQKMHIANSDKPVKFYSLDAIISVGYRVNSKRATQFRIWATKTLREYLTKGFVLNKQRLAQKYDEFEKAVKMIKSVIGNKQLSRNEEAGLLKVVTDYANTWIMLQKYDKGELAKPTQAKKPKYTLNYEYATEAINTIKKDLMKKQEASDIFGREREGGLESILKNLNQSFGGHTLYPTIEEKAAHLLYFIIKDHPFIDGNKRIGSFLFIVFLARNKYLFDKSGEKKFNDNALVALALLIAESRPKEKEVMIKLVINLVFG